MAYGECRSQSSLGGGEAVTEEEFERVLDSVIATLNTELDGGRRFATARDFEYRVREALVTYMAGTGIDVDFNPHPHVFPDIALGEFGVEVKFTTHDTWRSVANSIAESTRDAKIVNIYIVFGKMGGIPEVRWGRYDNSVIHVRTTHVPRFEVEINPTRTPLFEQMGTTYKEFSALTVEQKMRYIRNYARGRLKAGERLWWLEEKEEPEHSLPLEARLYTTLPNDEKRKLRAEAALMCPAIVAPSGPHKYDNAVLYLLTIHGVITYQVRDLFSAGSVAGPERGGNYVLRALRNIEPEMRDAALRLDAELFEEYWGANVEPEHRIAKWLVMADSYAQGWIPSDELFTGSVE